MFYEDAEMGEFTAGINNGGFIDEKIHYGTGCRHNKQPLHFI